MITNKLEFALCVKRKVNFMRISLITNDHYLYRYSELSLDGKATVVMRFDPTADIVLFDCDSGLELPETAARVIKLSRNGMPDTISVPLPYNFFRKLLLTTPEKTPLHLSKDGKIAFINGREVKLTTHESSLLSLLMNNGENFTSRDEISRAVWGDASDSLINVYIHYLREKLEVGGEKVIISSRKYGYRINPVYTTPSSQQTNEKQGGGYRD